MLRLRFRMGLIALAFVLVGTFLAPAFMYPLTAHALTQPVTGTAPFTFTATMIDAGEIGVVATGTVTTADGSFSIAPLSGIYFDSNVLNSGSDWPVKVGSQYYHNGVSGATCPSQQHNSWVKITNTTPASLTGTFDLWVPETGTNTPNQCIDLSDSGQDPNNYQAFQSEPISDTAVSGGSLDTFQGTETRTCGGGRAATCTGGYQAISVPTAPSTALFFEQSSTQIIEAGADPSIPGYNSGQQFIYTAGSTGDYVQTVGASGVNSQCPDYIAPFTGTGQYVQAKYYTVGSTTTGQPCAYTSPYNVLILTESPQAYYASIGGGGGSSDTGTVGTAASADTCPISNWALRWLVCPVLDAINGIITPINSLLDSWLTFPKSYFQNTSVNPAKAFFSAWGDFRDMAVSLLVIAALVMVIGESAGFDLLDAYSIRKILPRLLTGAIAMTLSWVICTFIIQLFNNLDNWLPDIIIYPFQGLYSNSASLTPSGVLGALQDAGGVALAGSIAIAGAVGAIAAFGVLAILSLLLSLFLALLVAFITLTIRTTLIILWLITSPLGIACYILPTTQRGYHFWRDTGVSCFVAGVVIVTFLACGRVMAILFLTGAAGNKLMAVGAPIAIVVSYYQVKRAFGIAGGLIGMAEGGIRAAHSAPLGKIKEFRRGQPKKRWEQAKAGHLYKGKIGEHLNGRIQHAAHIPEAIKTQGLGSVLNPKSGIKNVLRQAGELKSQAEAHGGDHIREKGEYYAPYAGNDLFDKAIYNSTGEGRAAFEEELRAEMGDQGFEAKFKAKGYLDRKGHLTDRGAVMASLERDGLDSEGLSGDEKKHVDESRDMLANRVMTAKHVYGNGEALLRAAVRSNWGTGTGFKNTEYRDDDEYQQEKVRQVLTTRVDENDPNSEFMFKEGRHYHVEEVRDKSGAVVYHKNADGSFKTEDAVDEHNNPLFELDQNGQRVQDKNADGSLKFQITTDQHGNAVQEAVYKRLQQKKAVKKLVLHDAAAKAYKMTNMVNGHDRDAAINMYAGGRGEAVQSGRADIGGAGFGDGLVQLNYLYDKIHEIEHNSTLSAEQKQLMMQAAMVEANWGVTKSAAVGMNPGQQTGGKPYSAEMLSRTHTELVKEAAAGVRAAEASRSQLQKAANPDLGAIAEAERRITVAQRELKQRAAGAADVWRTASYQAYLNAGGSSSLLMGQVIPGVGRDANGNAVDMTLLDYYSTIQGDADVLQYHQEYAGSPANGKLPTGQGTAGMTPAQAAQYAQQQMQGLGAPQAPTGIPPTGPP